MPTRTDPDWSDVAADRNQSDIGDYRNQPRSSIWDGTDHDPYDSDEIKRQDDLSEAERDEAERRAEANRGWFGDEDLNDARWGAERRHIQDPVTGAPVAQHGFGSKKFSEGSVRYGGPGHKAQMKLEEAQRKYRRVHGTVRHPIKTGKRSAKKRAKKKFLDVFGTQSHKVRW